MSPVGFPTEDVTSDCLCIEIRNASTPVTSTLFPANQSTNIAAIIFQVTNEMIGEDDPNSFPASSLAATGEILAFRKMSPKG